MIEHEKNRLDKIAGFYHSSEAAEAVDHFHLYLRDVTIPEDGGRSALELGCGSGRWTSVLCERYQEVDVVDAAADLVEQVVSAFKGKRAVIHGHVSLIEDFLKSTSRTWQHVYLTMLLEHVEDPIDILTKARKACDQDGSIFVAVPNASSIHRVIAKRAGLIGDIDELSTSDLKVGHRRVYTLDLLKDHLIEAGFSITEVIPLGLKPITHQQMRALPDSILWALCQSGDLVPENPAYWVVRAKA
ncbi:class I SAM-dependent methyltransferase [Methylotuvimicrobium alcaliphilum]|uniref:Methyltransferase type 12 n=1 Tax=Methylotuvimicrobium alcaliphilum (strain DSM 19304 / NCIMB 14124 / VKM B-2133 / 20Z) TaxID=1091494 RepID=G4SYW6_META2|nr:methyltransferase domain-containing protein [Methylotuvimicrobium alcaliphilum]CCE24413.1 protein of unknown function [Methylotuvimicrobium alcaliphilum 20Z]